jgi:hypothetical protein
MAVHESWCGHHHKVTPCGRVVVASVSCHITHTGRRTKPCARGGSESLSLPHSAIMSGRRVIGVGVLCGLSLCAEVRRRAGVSTVSRVSFRL